MKMQQNATTIRVFDWKDLALQLHGVYYPFFGDSFTLNLDEEQSLCGGQMLCNSNQTITGDNLSIEEVRFDVIRTSLKNYDKPLAIINLWCSKGARDFDPLKDVYIGNVSNVIQFDIYSEYSCALCQELDWTVQGGACIDGKMKTQWTLLNQILCARGVQKQNQTEIDCFVPFRFPWWVLVFAPVGGFLLLSAVILASAVVFRKHQKLSRDYQRLKDTRGVQDDEEPVEDYRRPRMVVSSAENGPDVGEDIPKANPNSSNENGGAQLSTETH